MQDDIGNGWKEGPYKYPLEDSLKAAIDKWKDARERSWTKPGVPENIQNIINDLEEHISMDRPFRKEEIFEIVEELAEAVKSASAGLVKSEALKKFGTKMYLFGANDDLFRYAEEHLEVHLAENIVEKLRNGADRLMSLEMKLSVIEKLNLNKTAINFLQLVVRSYIWGFNTECIIFCRSAVETVMRNKVTYEMCEKSLRKRSGYYKLADRIAVAKKEGLISDEICKIARDITQRGNKVLHDDPNLTENVEQTIWDTVRIISIVTRGKDVWVIPDWLK